MNVRRRVGTGIACVAVLLGAAAAAGPSDEIDGPLIRPPTSSSDPRDLSGVWFIRLYNPQINSTLGRLPPFTARGKAEWDARVKAEKDGSPIADASSYCWPHGVPRVMNSPYPIQIIQTAGETVFVHEVAHNVRHIYMDQPHPQTLTATFMGDSVGHWEGDTLVIDTIGLNDRTWIDEIGVIHGKQLHVIERIRKIEDGHALEDLIRIEDPEFFTEPWYARITYAWRPDLRIAEYVCEENNRNMPVSGHTVAR
ncbi:MAG TPA: hypothetical protein VMF03_10930 [Steroidobacteraceae bacterium]|nr:hypothetical protein [Steroidobacteraceae bacterium]